MTARYINFHFIITDGLRAVINCCIYVTVTTSGSKFTDDLGTILRQFSDLRQSYDNWRIHRTFMTILRPILRQNLTNTI